MKPPSPEPTLSELQRLAGIAEEAASRAAGHIRRWSGNHRDVFRKDGSGSPASEVVTEVDLACQEIILEHLERTTARDGFGLLTEESEDDSSRLDADCFWCIDPLDGTLPFIENIPGYSVSIALVSKEGISLLGAVHDPRTGTSYRAVRGGGIHRDGAPLTVTPRNSPCDLHWMMNRSMKTHDRYREIAECVEELASRFGFTGVTVSSESGGVIHACRVLQEAPAIYFTLPKTGTGGGSIWDYAATSCFFAEAGVPVRSAWGEPLPLNDPGTTFMSGHGVIYASSTELRTAVEDLAAKFLPADATRP